MVDKVTMEPIFTMYIISPCRYHSTNAPYSNNTDATEAAPGSITNDTQCVIIQKATNLNLLQRAAMQKKKRIKGCFALVYLHKVATGLSSYFCPVPNRNQPSATSSMRSAEEDNHNGSPPKQMKVSPVSVICLMVRAKVLE